MQFCKKSTKGTIAKNAFKWSSEQGRNLKRECVLRAVKIFEGWNPHDVMASIQRSISGDLLTPQYHKIRDDLSSPKWYTCHCYSITEASCVMLGDKKSSWYPCCITNGDGTTHWFLNHPILGSKLDPFKADGLSDEDYRKGKKSWFMAHPRKKTLILLARIVEDAIKKHQLNGRKVCVAKEFLRSLENKV